MSRCLAYLLVTLAVVCAAPPALSAIPNPADSLTAPPGGADSAAAAISTAAVDSTRALIESAAASAAATAGGADLAAFLALPEPERAERARQAGRWVEKWREFAAHVRRVETITDAQAGGASSLVDGTNLWRGFGRGAYDAVSWLLQAAKLDPSDPETWLALAGLFTDMGARREERKALAAADRALDASTVIRGERRDASRLEVARARAWLDRDEGRWDEGLSEVARGLKLAPGDLELTLVKGLLFADAGRFVEACAIARDLPAIEYHVYNSEQIGLRTSRSDYGSRWIQAMAYLATGERRLADYALGVLYPERRHVPFMHRYWNDVGLVAELNGRPEDAAECYAIALVTTPYHFYYPWLGFSSRPKILGEPDPRVPVYVFPAQYYLSGSLFAYGAQIAAEAEASADTAVTWRSGALADSALTLCIRRNVRPVFARALRGELRAVLHEDDLAKPDLETAREDLARQGLRNARTSLLLGILLLNDKAYPRALALMREAVEADSTLPSAWRMLGVALAESGRRPEARAAMTRAITIDPGAAEGYYNRGVLSLTERQWDGAVRDLRAAAARAPANPDIAKALARAERQLPDTVVTTTVVTHAETERLPEAPLAERLELHAAQVTSGKLALPRDQVGRLLAAVAESDTAARREVRRLEEVFRREPTPQAREQLAAAYLRTRRPGRALEVLASAGGKGLSPLELRVALEADRALGHADRARALAQSVDPQVPEPADRDYWSLVAVMCAGAGHPEEGLRAVDAALTLDPRNPGLIMYRQTLASEAGR